MIEQVHIEGLRGIAKGSVSELAPLTILVGPNGSGKSSVLDALLIGSHPAVGTAVGAAVGRRQGLDGGARWLLTRAAPMRPAYVWLVAGGTSVGTGIEGNGGTMFMQGREPVAPGVRFSCAAASVSFGEDNRATLHNPNPAPPAIVTKGVELLDSFTPYESASVTRLYTELLERNEYDAAETLLNEVSPSTTTPLRITTGADHNGRAILMVRTPRGAVPLATSGDGVKMFARLAMTLALSNTSLLLLEEPEAHLHPRTLVALASRIRQAVARGLQVVLTTHSLELVDQLAAQWQGPNRPREEIAVFRLALREGELLSTRFGSEEVATARFQDGDDLR